MYYKKIRRKKYRLDQNFTIDTPLLGYTVVRKYFSLSTVGTLVIQAGYQSDGPSGPTIDTRNTMVPAFVHDVLYEMMREGDLPRAEKGKVDNLFKEMLKARGVGRIRYALWWLAVSVAGRRSVESEVIHVE